MGYHEKDAEVSYSIFSLST